EIRSLGKRAKNKELRPQEMQGGTFTVSNLGMFGIDEFTAVINPGEGAIMAIGAVREELELRENGEVVSCRRMKVTLSSDHRVIDGAVGARFLGSFRDNLEHPMRMFA
ncbi:MAG: 2-oxo acid dehydrogenase subunit E2, partial [Nannocystaceae bacterium]